MNLRAELEMRTHEDLKIKRKMSSSASDTSRNMRTEETVSCEDDGSNGWDFKRSTRGSRFFGRKTWSRVMSRITRNGMVMVECISSV